MTITAGEMALYAGALVILFMTPGPVWLALTGRTLAGGFRAALPLALGVACGDVLWSLLAVLGLSWVVDQMDQVLFAIRLLGTALFLWMGISILRNADKSISADSRLTRPGAAAGFAAGVAAIIGNPKAILFYLGILPGFIDVAHVTRPDIAAILLISMAIPFLGNMVFAAFVDRARRLLSSGTALRRTNIVAGCLMILVGLVLPFT